MPPEAVAPPDRSAAETLALADTMYPTSGARDAVAAMGSLAGGTYVVTGMPDVDVTVLLPEPNDASRSHRRMFHGFSFLVDARRALRTTTEPAGRTGILDTVCELAGRWAVEHPRPVDLVATRRAWMTDMAYHDEATALRLRNLAGFVHQVRDELSDDQLQVLGALAEDARSMLVHPDFYNAGNNHGMYQDLALVYDSLVWTAPRADDAASQLQAALTRLETYFTSCFTAESVHIEHSPSYHLYISETLKGLADAVVTEAPVLAASFRRRYEAAARYITHVVTPAGRLPPISDNFKPVLAATRWHDLWDDPDYRYAVTRGPDGLPPKERTVVLRESGYAIFRESWLSPQATYLLMTAAHHSTFHKHNDDLSIYLERGQELLREAGPRGYDYANPVTLYGYSPFAHNSLVVDTVALHRSDKDIERVGIVSDVQLPGHRVVTGENRRVPGVVHQRSLKVPVSGPISTFGVTDTVLADGPHTYRLLWNCGPTQRAFVDEQSVDGVGSRGVARLCNGDDGETSLTIRWTATGPFRASVVRGQLKPVVLGWHCPSIGQHQPNDCLVLQADDVSDVSVRWEFELPDQQEPSTGQ